MVRSAPALVTGWVALAVGARAAPPPASPVVPAVPVLPVVIDERCADARAASSLLDALRARLPEVELAARAPGDGPPDALAWSPDATGACRLTLGTIDGPVALALGPGAGEGAIRAAAIRVAWWLELARAAPAAPVPVPPPVAVAPPTPVPPVPSPVEPVPPATTPAATMAAAPASRDPIVRFGVGFGAAWYPTPGEPAGLVRLTLLVPILGRVAIGVEARLVSEVLVSESLDVDVYDRTVGLAFRYDAPVSQVAVGLGFVARYAFSEIDADQLTGIELAKPASSLMIASGVGLGYDLVEGLSLRADAMVALTLGGRRLVAGDMTVGDLGVVCFDLTVGLELAL